MELKNSKYADAMGNLYRSALYLAKGDIVTAIDFLKKTPTHVKGDVLIEVNSIIDNKDEYLKTEKKQKYWAEIILDKYQIVKSQLLSNSN